MAPIFSGPSLSKAIAAEIEASGIPTDHKGAFALVATKTGLKAVVAAKINDAWRVESIVGVDYQGEVNAAITLKGSW